MVDIGIVMNLKLVGISIWYEFRHSVSVCIFRRVLFSISEYKCNTDARTFWSVWKYFCCILLKRAYFYFLLAIKFISCLGINLSQFSILVVSLTFRLLTYWKRLYLLSIY